MTAKHATAAQLATNGHIAAALRAALKARKLSPAQANITMGKSNGASGIHLWVAGRSVPGPEARKALSKALGIAEANLLPRASASMNDGRRWHGTARRRPPEA